MKINPYAVTGLVLGAVAIGLSERHHRENRNLFFVRQHSELLRDAAADPRLMNSIRSAHWDGLSDDEIASMTMANRWLSMWKPMVRSGFLSRSTMRRVAETFMESETNRRFWRIAAPVRRTEFRDRHDERFHNIVEDAFADTIEQRPSTPNHPANSGG
ncbi:DUF6082 family protein [Streptomyces sp. SID14515]|uniref:DUF6082 family protein n=1 Tax=Streptomyces sp. SID14515 TaxID=2706074 RepID=UPI0013CC1015|nr:DUF6082 family protein [Streptomyces sp. SID14515]NEB42577.1 hypothetical protein [Streptomyces sp. SID14515]